MYSRSLFSIILGISMLGLFGFSQSAFAAPYTLTNSPGDGTVTVGVDGFGAFGLAVGPDSTNARYDPVGVLGPTDTTFDTGTAIRMSTTSGTRQFLTSGIIGGSGSLTNPTVTGSSTSGTSSFSFGGLSFTLIQTLTPLLSGSSQTGSTLTQTYTITNPSGSPVSFELVRYLDGDLRFDGSLIDGGGRLIAPDGTEILFETDTAAGTGTSTTFVGITGNGGTAPASNRYEVDSYSGLSSRIIGGFALDDTITGDGADSDQFIDTGSGYDVTLALRNTFSLGSGASVVYVTKTIFGSGAPEDVGGNPVGGELLPIDTTALVIAGIQSGALWALPTLGAVVGTGLGLFYFQIKRKQ